MHSKCFYVCLIIVIITEYAICDGMVPNGCLYYTQGGKDKNAFWHKGGIYFKVHSHPSVCKSHPHCWLDENKDGTTTVKPITLTGSITEIGKKYGSPFYTTDIQENTIDFCN